MRVTLNVEIDMLLCCFEIYALYVDHMNVELHLYLVIYIHILLFIRVLVTFSYYLDVIIV